MTNPNEEKSLISRRDFVRTAALTAGAVASGLGLLSSEGTAAPEAQIVENQAVAAKPMIGFQAEVTYLMEYGVALFLDDVQTRVGIERTTKYVYGSA